ncbi:MAG: type VI secretion lipoprotein TssJ [Myxococcales bacterium]|nr:type VI secretion lipoprotein TssJ [Myxococcales bacterium]
MRCSAGILCRALLCRALLCRALLCRALLFGVGALAVSCGGSTPSPGPAPLSAVRVEVVAHPTANHGRSVRMLVREIDGPTTFLTDEYGAMVRLATQPDESVLADRFLRPGTTLDLQVTPHPEKSLAVYVFFSTPHATKWKARLRDGRTTVRLEVLENAVEVR